MSESGDALLRALRKATAAYEADSRYDRWDGYFISFGNARGLKPALLGGADGLDVRAGLIDELTDAGDLRQVEPPTGSAGGRKFTLTSEGRERADATEQVDQPRDQRMPTVVSGGDFDVFLSHASEDKEQVVIPLAEELQRRGVRVWLDKQQLTLGDSLSQKIDEGLASARFGVVVLSQAFFSKNWPRRELDGLVARETAFGTKVILPIWHGVTQEQIVAFSPPLAVKLAADTSMGIDSMAAQIQEALGGPLRPGLAIRRVDDREASDPPAGRDDPTADLLAEVRDAVLGQRLGDVRTRVVQQLNLAQAALTLTDGESFGRAMTGLTTIAAAVAAAMPQDPVAGFALDAYHRLFESTGEQLRRGGLEAEATVSLWPDMLAHVRGLGALLIRYELWGLTRRLAEHSAPPESVDIYPGWICFMEVQLARRRRDTNAEVVRQPLRRAAGLIAAVPALAPDGPSENARLDSVLRFDLISRVVETSLASREGRTTETYPPFARFDVTPLRSLVRRLAQEQALADQLLPGLGSDAVLSVLGTVDAHAARAAGENVFWDGIADPELQRRIKLAGS